MKQKEILIFVDDAIGYDSLVDGTLNAMISKSAFEIKPFKDFDSSLEKGIILKEHVKYCVLDPLLSNSDALEREYLYDSTLFRIDSLLKFVNNDLRIVVLTSLIDDGKLENKIKEKFNSSIDVIYKKDYIKNKELLTDQLADKILSCLLI